MASNPPLAEIPAADPDRPIWGAEAIGKVVGLTLSQPTMHSKVDISTPPKSGADGSAPRDA